MSNPIINKSERPMQDKELRNLRWWVERSHPAHSKHPKVTQELIESVDVIEVDFQLGKNYFAGIEVEFGLALVLLHESEKPINVHNLYKHDETGNWHLGLPVLFEQLEKHCSKSNR